MCNFGTANLGNLFNYGTCVLTAYVIPLLFTIAAVFFVWGVVKFFIIDAGEEAKRTQGKQFIIWGVLAMVVISSVWAIVNVLGGTFGIGTRVLPGITPNNQGLRGAINSGSIRGGTSTGTSVNTGNTIKTGNKTSTGGSGSGGSGTGGGGGGTSSNCWNPETEEFEPC